MTNREWRFVDKSGWGDGPWQAEPDKVQWRDEKTGLPCLIVRGPRGALCGYVGVSSGHPAFGVADYDGLDLSVHGGLTFGDYCAGTEHGICHVVEDGEDDHVYWLGFDCAHAWDIAPKSEAEYLSRGYLPDSYSVYRDLLYVKSQVTQLAEQLAAQTGGAE